MQQTIRFSYRQIFFFWLPLALMWIVMAIEQPGLAAVIARLPDETLNLAAFGIAFSIALVIESPVIQLLSAGTALCSDRRRYFTLLRFMHLLGAGLTLLHLLVAATPLFAFIVRSILGVPERLVEPSRIAFLTMTPFAALVGYRRLWQGVLIRYGHTSVIPVTMIVRLGAVAAVLVPGYLSGALAGATLAGVALIAGVGAGCIASWAYARRVVRDEIPEQTDDPLSVQQLLSFYVPLSLTSVIFLSAQPLLTFGMARALFPTESLAVWPVINGYVFLFNSMGLSFQEAVVAILGRSGDNYDPLRRFAFYLATVLGVLFLTTAFTPASRMWFQGVSGLSQQLLPFTTVPVMMLFLVPVLTTVKSWFRGRLIHDHRTGALATAVAIHSVVLFFCVWLGPMVFDLPGTVLAAGSLIIALLSEAAYLSWSGYRVSLRVASASA